MSKKARLRVIKEKLDHTSFDNEAGQITLILTATMFLAEHVVMPEPVVSLAVTNALGKLLGMLDEAGERRGEWYRLALLLSVDATSKGLYYQDKASMPMTPQLAARIVGLVIASKTHVMQCFTCPEQKPDCFERDVFQPLWPFLKDLDDGLSNLGISLDPYQLWVALSFV